MARTQGTVGQKPCVKECQAQWIRSHVCGKSSGRSGSEAMCQECKAQWVRSHAMCQEHPTCRVISHVARTAGTSGSEAMCREYRSQLSRSHVSRILGTDTQKPCDKNTSRSGSEAMCQECMQATHSGSEHGQKSQTIQKTRKGNARTREQEVAEERHGRTGGQASGMKAWPGERHKDRW